MSILKAESGEIPAERVCGGPECKILTDICESWYQLTHGRRKVFDKDLRCEMRNQFTRIMHEGFNLCFIEQAGVDATGDRKDFLGDQ